MSGTRLLEEAAADDGDPAERRGVSTRRETRSKWRAAGGSSRRRARRTWNVERLEERRVMAADIASEVAAGLPTFGSVDELKNHLRLRAEELYSEQFGKPTSSLVYPLWGDGVFLANRVTVGDSASSPVVAETTDHSTTNIQVAGVDEADFIETDGAYSYLARHGELTIVSLHPANSLAVVGNAKLSGVARGMFLRGDRLTVISSTWHSWPLDPPSEDGLMRLEWAIYNRSRVTTVVSIFDVSDPTSPSVIDRTEIDGEFVDARAVEDHVFVETSKFDGSPPQLRMRCSDGPPRPWYLPAILEPGSVVIDGSQDAVSWIDGRWNDDTTCTFETREEYFSHLEAELDSLVDEMLPHFSTWIGGDTFVRGGSLIDPADLVRPIRRDANHIVSVTSFQVFDNQPGPVAAIAMLAQPASARLGTENRLYWFQNDASPTNGETMTRIVSIDWSGATGELRAEGKGEVLGYALNSFSADQLDERLRIVTTRNPRIEDETWIESESLVSVLELNGADWNVVGHVTGLAPGEQVRAARFAGETAYVVTFRQIDPLFVIDLSDPTTPRVQGELKIPGFSGYLQSLDATHLLGVGLTPSASNWRWNVELSVFDVSDPTKPERIGQYAFPDEFDSTVAMFEHHALSYFPQWNVVGLPVHGLAPRSSDGNGGGYVWGDYQHLAFLKVDLSGDAAPGEVIKPVGRVADLSTNVFGSFRSGGNVYVATDRELVAVVGANPSQELGRVQFTPPLEPWYGSGIYDGTAMGFATLFDSRDPTVSGNPIEPWTGERVEGALDVGLQWASLRFGVDPSAVRLVSVEATKWEVDGEVRRGYNLVLAISDRRILARVDESLDVELVSDDFEYASELLTGEWRNADAPLDTNSDGTVSPLDGLMLINELNRRGSIDLRRARPLRSIDAETASTVMGEFSPQPFLDVNGDDYLSPIDALLVINWLNAPAGDGESSAEPTGESWWSATAPATLPAAARWTYDLARDMAAAKRDEMSPLVTDSDESNDGAFDEAALADDAEAEVHGIVALEEAIPMSETEPSCAGGWDYATAIDKVWNAADSESERS